MNVVSTCPLRVASVVWQSQPETFAVTIVCLMLTAGLRRTAPAPAEGEDAAFLSVLVGVYPLMIPPSLSLFDAASPSNTLRFMLYGIGPLLPIVLTYNWYLAHVFRAESKVDARMRARGY